MPSTPISQREARRLRRRVDELEQLEHQRRRSWAQDWPGGTSIAVVTLEANHPAVVAIRVARRLNHAVVVTTDDTGWVNCLALPLAGGDRG